MSDSTKQSVLVLGATGYVGGRLVPRLLEAGYAVRAASRSLNKLRSRPWATHENASLAAVEVTDRAQLETAMQGCDVIFYLVHSMNPSHQDFAEADRKAAEILTAAAASAGVFRIIYLGGLGNQSEKLSKHLRSRGEVAEILKNGTVPVTVLRAAMIIGSGSASFEILRYLVERLPLMITPKWVNTPSQPISIRNVLNYLVGCLEHPETENQTYDIGGAEEITYLHIMETYAEEAHLKKRWVIPVPFFTPTLSSYWIHLVTPLPSYLARPLAEGLKNPAICQENSIQAIIPQDLLTCREAIKLALRNIGEHHIETHWSDAGSLPPVESVYPGDSNWAGGTLYIDRRDILIQATCEEVWAHLVRIGGKNGWYYGDWLWRLRGLLDILIGGVGHRRGRRDPYRLTPGDALDFWRVLAVQAPTHLKLLAEMKLPGKAFLSFELNQEADNQTRLTQTAWYIPRGLSGLAYWYAVMPFHHFVFNGMLKGIAHATGKPLLSEPTPVHPVKPARVVAD